MKNHLSSRTCEPKHDKTKEVACVPSKDLDQPGHRHTANTLTDWLDALADVSFPWVHMPVCWVFYVSWLSCLFFKLNGCTFRIRNSVICVSPVTSRDKT